MNYGVNMSGSLSRSVTQSVMTYGYSMNSVAQDFCQYSVMICHTICHEFYLPGIYAAT